jgi:hypothetical protein
MQFVTPDGITLQAGHPIVQAAMLVLGEAWPRAIPFEELLSRAHERLEVGTEMGIGVGTVGRPAVVVGAGSGDPRPALAGDARPARELPAAQAEALGRSLLQFYVQASTSLVEFWIDQPRFAAEAGARPTASGLARRQAATGSRVATLRHETAQLGDFERQVLRLLDGTRDRADLADELVALALNGELTVERDGRPVRGAAELRPIVTQALDAQLTALARNALLVASK